MATYQQVICYREVDKLHIVLRISSKNCVTHMFSGDDHISELLCTQKANNSATLYTGDGQIRYNY